MSLLADPLLFIDTPGMSMRLSQSLLHLSRDRLVLPKSFLAQSCVHGLHVGQELLRYAFLTVKGDCTFEDLVGKLVASREILRSD